MLRRATRLWAILGFVAGVGATRTSNAQTFEATKPLVLFFPAAVHSNEAGQLELKIKAAYLLNFGRHVKWPNLEGAGEMGICVLGEDPFGAILDRTAAGRKVQGIPVKVKRVESGEALKDCQIVYLSPQIPPDEEKRILSNLKEKPILTVGDSRGFVERGGIVNFAKAGNTVRFEVNLVVAREAGLEISSRVLALAVAVKSEEISR